MWTYSQVCPYLYPLRTEERVCETSRDEYKVTYEDTSDKKGKTRRITKTEQRGFRERIKTTGLCNGVIQNDILRTTLKRTLVYKRNLDV